MNWVHLKFFFFVSAKSESESASEEKPSDDASPDADKVAEDESAEPKEAEAGSETEEPEKETTTAETTEEEKKDELWTFQFILWSFKKLKHTPIAIVSAILNHLLAQYYQTICHGPKWPNCK